MSIEDKIIEQKGIGKYIGKVETNLGKIDVYEKYVELRISSGNYCINLFHPLYPEDNLENVSISCGTNLKFAEAIYNRIIEKDNKEKQNLIHKIFSKN